VGWWQPYVLSLVCTWAQDERPADLHMAQPNVPVIKTGHIPPARLVRGEFGMSSVCRWSLSWLLVGCAAPTGASL
jgi:hypothetical protein